MLSCFDLYPPNSVCCRFFWWVVFSLADFLMVAILFFCEGLSHRLFCQILWWVQTNFVLRRRVNRVI